MNKVKKKLKKGWDYFEHLEELEQNINIGNTRVFIDNKHEICDFHINDNEVSMWCSYIPDDLKELFAGCEYIDSSEDFFDLYETTYENFRKIFTVLIEARRLCYPKRQ